jgi:hypothetical protein
MSTVTTFEKEKYGGEIKEINERKWGVIDCR